MADRLGIVYVELDLDKTKFERNQQQIIQQANSTALSIEKNYQILGVKSDNIYNAMAQGARNAYERIANASKVSADEQFRAQSAMVAKINALNQEMTKNPLYDQMGIRSMAAINESKDAVLRSYDVLKTAAAGNATEIVRIERAKNEKLKELNKEMTGSHEMSIASMQRALLRLYATYYIISSVISTVSSWFMSGINAIDEMKVSVVAVAAQITSMQGTTGNVTENYRKNVEYAKALVPVLMQVDAASFANFEEIQLMNRAATQHGVILDLNNAKQIEAFTAITNSVRLLTTGQNKTIQASQEIRALTSGMIRPTDAIALQIDSIIKQQGVYRDGLKEVVSLSKKHGDLYERLAPYLVGMVAASGDIQTTWAAVSSSLETAWGIIQRGLFKDVYKDLTISGGEAVAWMKKNADDIVASINTIWTAIKTASELAIAAMAAFAISSWMAMIKAGDAAAWFILKWEAMCTAINLQTSKLLIGWNVFLAGMVGFSIGNWISNEFEWARLTAIKFVYGVMGSWDYLVSKIKVGWEMLKGFGAMSADPKNAESISKQYLEKIKKIQDDYDKEREAKGIQAYEQLLANTDKEIALAKERAKQLAKILTPVVGKGAPSKEESDAAKKSAEEQARLMEKIWKIQEDVSLAGLDGPRKAFEQNRIEAEKLRHELENTAGWNRLSKAQKDTAFSAIDSIQKMKDQGIVNTMVQKSREDNAKATVKETAEIDKAKDAYDRLMNTVAPVTDRAYEMAKATEIVTAMFEKGTPEWQAAIDKVNAYYAALNQKDTMAGFEKAVEEARKMVTFYNDLNNMESEYRNAKLTWIEKEAALKKAKGAEEVAIARWVAEQKVKLDREQMESVATKFDYDNKYINETISNTGKMIDAAQTMYDKDSDEYKRLAEAKKVIQIAELAMVFAKNAQIVASNIATMMSNAGSAVTGAAIGVGPTGFATAAAMIALMASVFSMYGVANGGGGSASISAPSAAYGQNTTVLGGANNEASESIQKSWELMQDTYDMEYRELSGIYSEMKNLNQNITGLVTSYIRTGGISHTDFGINLGTTIGSAEKFASSYIAQNAGILTTIGNFANKPLVDIFRSVFGGGTKTWSGGTGISLGTESVANLLQGGVMPASYYAVTGHKKSGGWFHSDKTWVTTTYQALDEDVSNLITKVFSNIGDTLVSLSTGLGANIQDALNYTFESVAINLEGLDAEAITKKLNETFSGIMDTAASDLFGNIIRQYQEVGEGLLETATRLLTNKSIVSYWVDKMNQSFQGTIPEAIKFSDTLVTIAGSLEDLTDAMQTYYDKFFNDSEKQAKLKQDLMGEFSALGYGLPEDRADYRALVESLNLATDAGQAAYVALMQMSEGADQYYSYLEDAKDAVKSNISPENYTTNLAYQRALAGLPAYADGGSFAGGYRIVGENGPEIEYTAPSRIYSNKDSKSLLNNDELVAEIRALREELGAGNYQIAANTQKSAKYLQYLEQWDDDGTPPVRN